MEILGVEVKDLPDNYTPLDIIVLLSCLDETGDKTIVLRSSEGCAIWEQIGMLRMAEATMVKDALDSFEEE